MKYMGSKARIANEILPIILKNRKPDQYYVEPFCGGCNIIDKVDGNRIASDSNKYLIEMFKGLQENYNRPIEIRKELYNRARTEYNNGTNIEFSDFEIGWIGFMGSFNGRFFDGGYSGIVGKRNYISEQIRNTESQIRNIIGIEFNSCSYNELDIPYNSIIYCDPPYKDTKQYSTSKNFDHDKFWAWCDSMVKKGHKVYVSEYSAPDGWRIVWQKEVFNSLDLNTGSKKGTEKLFTK